MAQFVVMRWYLNINGRIVGPEEGEMVEQFGREGLLPKGCYVRDEAGGDWMPVERSPFALAVRDVVSEELQRANKGDIDLALTVTARFGAVAAAIWSYWMSSPYWTSSPGVDAQAAEPQPGSAFPPEGLLDRVDQIWRAYDALPPDAKEDTCLMGTFQRSEAMARQATGRGIPLIETASRAMCRERMAPLFHPEARAFGPFRAVLIPSPTKARCELLSFMWFHEEGVVAALKKFGFTTIQCGDRSWRIE